ncbi:MAG TPA: NUDIX domain-containing protein [Candidatus Saccharimonadales bacterium]
MTHWTERHKTLLAVFVLLRRADGKILLIRRANTGYMDGKLGLPAGHAEGNEPAELALVREAAEEVDVVLDPKDLRLVLTSHRLAEEGGYEYIDLYFETATWQGEPRNAEPNKCSEVLWIDPAQLPDDVIPVVRTALAHIAAGEPYFSIGF